MQRTNKNTKFIPLIQPEISNDPTEVSYPSVENNSVTSSTYLHPSVFITEGGEEIQDLLIAYHTYGNQQAHTGKTVWICHALTGDSAAGDWWKGIVGENKLFDPNKDFIVCANILGSCYGTSGPAQLDSEKKPYLDRFPFITPRDMAKAHELLRVALKINEIDVLIGSSLGGQQAMEWAIDNPSVFRKLILIATNARHSPFGIAFNESQRMAIYNDTTYGNGNISDAKEGLSVARSIAMLSYRSYEGYGKTQSEETDTKTNDFRASSYQNYQGEKLANRFNAYSYIALSKAMDAHNVGRNRNSIEAALGQISAETLIIGIDSDLLFPLSEQRFLAENIKGAEFRQIASDFGHDGFLVENDQLVEIILPFIEK